MGEGDARYATKEDRSHGEDARADQRMEDEREWQRMEEVPQISYVAWNIPFSCFDVYESVSIQCICTK